jgi:hypothetical protein
MYEHRHAPLASRRAFMGRVAGSVGIALVLIFGSLAFGMCGYRYFEGMPWIDAFLNAAMLLGGMGPTKPDLVTPGGKLFAGFYALYAGMLVLVAASILIAPVFHRFIHRFHLEQSGEAKPPRARN